MNEVTVLCPKCSADYRLPTALLGKRAQCKHCGETFVLVVPGTHETQTAVVDLHGDDHDTSASFELGPIVETPPVSSESPLETGNPATWRVGDRLLGVYEIRALSDTMPYAEGGMGLVHRVFHHGWNLELAVKSPKSETFETEIGKQSFERECQTWIELGMHPNIVTCYLVRRMGGMPRVFAEFVGEGSLRDWVRDKRLYEGGQRESLRRILDIAIQIAWGLDFAHRHGVVHLDVKPANVMMQDGQAKVTDFGLARAQFNASDRRARSVSASHSPEEASGVKWEGMTPAFCSPEQKQAAEEHHSGVSVQQQVKLTKATDVWSWALSVLTMFHGKPPCRQGGQTAHRVFEAFLRREAEDTGRPTMPEPMIDVMRRCFQVAPEDRPKSMSEIADAVIGVYERTLDEPYSRTRPVDTELTADSLNNRAASLLDLGKWSEAKKLLDEAWELRPWQPRVTFNRVLLSWRTGAITDLEAVTAMHELCKTRAGESDAFYGMGLMQMERGDMKSAHDALEQAFALARSADRDHGSVNDSMQREIAIALERAASLRENVPRCVNSFAAGSVTEETDTAPPIGFVNTQANLLLFPGREGMLQARDTYQGRTRFNFQPPTGSGNGVSLSRDLQFELRPCPDRHGCLEICEAATGAPLHQLAPLSWGREREKTSPDGRYHLSFGPDGTTLLLKDLAKDKPPRVLRGHTGAITAAQFSRDGAFIISGACDLTVRIWETATGRCLRTLIGHTHPIEGIFPSPDGRWIVSLSGQRGIRLWNVELLCDHRRRYVAPLLLSVVISSEETAREQNRFTEIMGRAKAASRNGDIDEVLACLAEARTMPGFEAVRKSISPWKLAGQYSARHDAIDAWCVQVLDGDGGEVRAAMLSPDARWCVSGGWDGCVRLWHAASGRCLRSFQGHNDWVRAIGITPDQKRLVTASWDRTIRLWEVATGKCLHVFDAHAKQIDALAVGASGRLAVSGAWDGSIRLWDLRGLNMVRSISAHDGYVHAVDITSDGQFVVSAGDDQVAKLWDTATGRERFTFAGHEKPILAVAISPDRRTLATASEDATLKLWSCTDGRCLQTLEGHNGAVTSVAFTPDGQWLISGSRDRTLRLWHLPTGECRRVIEGHGDLITCVSVSETARWALSGSKDETARLWELDWEFAFPGWQDWSDEATPYLESFLASRRQVFSKEAPSWTEEEFDELIRELGRRGFGYLKPEGVRDKLNEMAGR